VVAHLSALRRPVVADRSTLYATARMLSSRPKLKFGIMNESQVVPAWAAQCVRQLLASGHAECVVFIQRQAGARPRRPSARETLHRLYEQRWLQRRSRALQRVDLGAELAGVQQLRCAPGSERQSLAPGDLEKLRGYGLDFILSFGESQLAGEILDLPRAGVWSYRHDREPAPYFWELLSGNARTRASLDRLAAGGEVRLHQGFFGTCKASWVNNLDRAAFGSSDFCARVSAELRAASDGALQREPEPLPGASTEPSSQRPPDNAELVQFFLRSGAHGLSKLWELLFHVEIWNVGFTPNSFEQILRDSAVDETSVSWCTAHATDHFIADPFAYQKDGEEHVLVEDYVLGKGRICRLTGAPGGPRLELEVAFDFPYHMSYPCIFYDGGETYCIPETYQAGNVSLYRRTKEGWEWVRNLLQGPIVDPTVFKHEGRYWLLYTLQDDGAWGNLKLYACHAERLDGEWTPHLLNPIKCDIGSSRPAGGVVQVGIASYRPSQDCSETYGGAVVMNRILRLSPTEFEEVEAARIEPMRNGPYPAGLHTINAMASQTLIDSKKFAFDWLAWRKNWGRLHEVFK
jgi:hypothetical protein